MLCVSLQTRKGSGDVTVPMRLKWVTLEDDDGSAEAELGTDRVGKFSPPNVALRNYQSGLLNDLCAARRRTGCGSG